MKRTRYNSGYTLYELLVVILLLGGLGIIGTILGTILWMAIHFISKVW